MGRELSIMRREAWKFLFILAFITWDALASWFGHSSPFQILAQISLPGRTLL
jgi:hypothetical protein